MDLGLEGRRALVLAGTRGLGRAIAAALAAEGAEVALCGREGVDDAAAAISTGAARPAWGLTCDLHDRAAVSAMTARIMDRWGGVDVLVLNGGGPPPAPAATIPGDDWRLWFDRMAATLIEVAGVFVPGMQTRGWGRVLTVGSSAAVAPIAHMALSNSLRAALLAWNKTLAAEVAADGVTCNVILPGRIDTDRVRALDAAKAARECRAADEVRAESLSGIPAGRYGRPEEFGDVAAFLCSDRAAYVTGSLVRVDGGMIRAV